MLPYMHPTPTPTLVGALIIDKNSWSQNGVFDALRVWLDRKLCPSWIFIPGDAYQIHGFLVSLLREKCLPHEWTPGIKQSHSPFGSRGPAHETSGTLQKRRPILYRCKLKRTCLVDGTGTKINLSASGGGWTSLPQNTQNKSTDPHRTVLMYQITCYSTFQNK